MHTHTVSHAPVSAVSPGHPHLENSLSWRLPWVLVILSCLPAAALGQMTATPQYCHSVVHPQDPCPSSALWWVGQSESVPRVWVEAVLPTSPGRSGALLPPGVGALCKDLVPGVVLLATPSEHWHCPRLLSVFTPFGFPPVSPEPGWGWKPPGFCTENQAGIGATLGGRIALASLTAPHSSSVAEKAEGFCGSLQ